MFINRFIVVLFLVLAFGLPTRMHAEEKAGFSVTRAHAEEAAVLALQAGDVVEHAKATIINPRDGVLYTYGKPLSVSLENMVVDDVKRSFHGNLFLRYEQDVVSVVPVSGNYTPMVALPALNQRMRSGDVIQSSDITTTYYPEDRIRDDMVMKPEELIGKAPARFISARRPVRMTELKAPDIIKKGAIVTSTYNTAFMRISTSVEALEGGAMGDMIRVRNVDSGVVVSAKITSATMVDVPAPVRDQAQ